MSVYFYDKAIVDRTRKVINDDNVHIINSEKMFTKSKEANDDPEMPAISIYREGYSITSSMGKSMPMYREGRSVYDDKQEKLFTVRAIPITIKYQYDVWTRTREQNDEYVRDLLWFFMLYPEHTIQISYRELNLDINFNAFLEDNILDNSDINEFENRGQYYRSTFNLTVDEAQLFMVKEIPTYTAINLTVKSFDMEGVEFTVRKFNVTPKNTTSFAYELHKAGLEIGKTKIMTEDELKNSAIQDLMLRNILLVQEVVEKSKNKKKASSKKDEPVNKPIKKETKKNGFIQKEKEPVMESEIKDEENPEGTV